MVSNLTGADYHRSSWWLQVAVFVEHLLIYNTSYTPNEPLPVFYFGNTMLNLTGTEQLRRRASETKKQPKRRFRAQLRHQPPDSSTAPQTQA